SPKIKTILTIHNLFYQGLIPEKEISKLGLNKEALPKDHKDPKQINLLKLGILYSDIVTTVSPTYAKEILTKEMGCGLEKDLLTRPVLGILNGLDTEFWNPAKDPKIPFHY
ncbi:MAG: glycogen/starch synthase, partial [Simkaniaceae bacterium]|nr:glycogen/starch synthase [Simkaniaceae bacterium]